MACARNACCGGPLALGRASANPATAIHDSLAHRTAASFCRRTLTQVIGDQVRFRALLLVLTGRCVYFEVDSIDEGAHRGCRTQAFSSPDCRADITETQDEQSPASSRSVRRSTRRDRPGSESGQGFVHGCEYALSELHGQADEGSPHPRAPATFEWINSNFANPSLK